MKITNPRKTRIDSRSEPQLIILEPNVGTDTNSENKAPGDSPFSVELDPALMDYSSSDISIAEQLEAEQAVNLRNLKMLEEEAVKSYRFYSAQVKANSGILMELAYKHYLSIYKAYELCFNQCAKFTAQVDKSCLVDKPQHRYYI